MMPDDVLLTEMQADADELARLIPDDTKLRSISGLAADLVKKKAELVQLEKDVESKKAEISAIEENALPDLLAQLGLSELKLLDGSLISVEPEYYATIPSADSNKPELLQRRESCFDWLRNNKHGDLIKQELKLTFSRGEDALARRTINGLDKAGIPYRNTEQVHASTLKVFVREQVEKGTPNFPRETFGVHVKQVAKVKPVKK